MSIAVEIRPLTTEELGLVEGQVNFDWAGYQKHRERLCRQNSGKAIYLVAWYRNIPVGHVLLEWSGTDLGRNLLLFGKANSGQRFSRLGLEMQPIS